MTAKIISDELITQINDQLKDVVANIVEEKIRNIDWSSELDLYGLIQDELNNMDILDYVDSGSLEDKISNVLEGMLSELTISRGH